jgi:hypothetical protein
VDEPLHAYCAEVQDAGLHFNNATQYRHWDRVRFLSVARNLFALAVTKVVFREALTSFNLMPNPTLN